VESFGHGLTVVQELVPQGYPIRKVVPDVDKVSRALVAVARYEEHRVFHPRLAPWRREWEDELLAFPPAERRSGRHVEHGELPEGGQERLAV
jgi:predicted phage terminase large subunit-like protein